MPVYEFVCNKCGKQYECERSISKRNMLSICPSCGSENTRRVPSVASFVLKGTGWYATDYKGKK